jgi:hypothetical protein
MEKQARQPAFKPPLHEATIGQAGLFRLPSGRFEATCPP